MEQKVAKSIEANEGEYTNLMKLKDAYSGNLSRIFSERLTKLMKNTTQEEVAKDTGITRQNLSKYMLGKSLPNTKNLFILAKYFDVSCDYLLGFINLPHNELSHFRLKLYFSTKCTKNLEYISKDAELSKVFDRLVTNNKFIHLLRYIETYLTFSASIRQGSTERFKECSKKVKMIDASNNDYISFEALPNKGINVSEAYKGLIQTTIYEIILMIAAKYSSEYTEKITRIVQEELFRIEQEKLTNIKDDESNDSPT